jgi:acyl-CoA thioester hydrolase
MSNLPSVGSSAPGPAPQPDDFPCIARDKLRYGDTDRQGHVNNAVFSTFFETGRVELLFSSETDLMGPDGSFVLARLQIDFRKELKWPGEVEIGTRVVTIGRSSLRFEQAVFNQGDCIATAETIVVLTDVKTRKSRPFSDAARACLESKTRRVRAD